ncbi:MAG: hypothetical protein KDB25_04845 [Leucobacter sp.]|nr:hypothetical protein [Leucobacter sp.]
MSLSLTGSWETVAPLGAPDALQPETPERRLRPVTAVRPGARSRRGRSPVLAAFGCAVIVLAIFATQLGLSIAVSEGAYQVRALEIEQRDLVRVERVLAQNVDRLSSPQNLAENAAKLGMVQNVAPATLRLSDHKVLGSLKARTTKVAANLVPNAALEGLPVVNAEGLMVSRNAGQAAADATASAAAPVTWRGKLPAPDTH